MDKKLNICQTIEASNTLLKKVELNKNDKFNLDHIKYAQGLGAALRYSQEIHSAQQISRLPFLKSSHLQEDVLRGRLGPGNGLDNTFNDDEVGLSRLAYL